MSGKHTQGRIGVIDARSEGFCLAVDGRLGAEIVAASEDECGHFGPIKNEANAYRLAACWNAFEGVDSKQIPDIANSIKECNHIIGQFLRWVEAGNGNNLQQTMASAFIHASYEWNKNRLEEDQG